MKTFLAFIFAVLTVLPVAAQNPVLLEEWYSLSEGAGYLSYLPNFDIERNGKNVVVSKSYYSGTWYNRFPFDTINQFSWSGNGYFKIVQGDFNGDKIMDYMDSEGWLYLGIENGKPPSATFSLRPITNLNMHTTIVGDFTADGIDDIITSGKSMPEIGGTDGYLVIGNSDTNRIRSLSFTIPQNHTRTNLLLAAYINNSKGRIISYGYEEDTGEGFYLWSVELETTGEPTVKLVLLDKVERNKLAGAPRYYSYYDFMLYSHPTTKEHIALLLSYPDFPMAYQITNDKWGNPQPLPQKVAEPSYMPISIDNDTIPDWIATLSQTQRAVFSGKPDSSSVPRVLFPRLSCGGSPVVCAISDVNGDSIGDFAAAFRDGCFRIYLGVDWKAVGVTENQEFSFHIEQSVPSPVSVNSQSVVTISIEKQGNYSLTLYSLSGGEIGKIFSGDLPSGEHSFVIEPKRFSLTHGLYNLRLTDGKHTREHSFMVGGK